MRLLLHLSFVVAAAAAHQTALLRGGNADGSINNNNQEVQEVAPRDLSEHHTGFAPLSCNDVLAPCVTWTSQSYDPAAGQVTIPCGECIIMDAEPSSTSGIVNLPRGLDIQGKLIFPPGYQAIIHSPYVFVQGILDMSSTRATSSQPDVTIVLTDDDEQLIIPHLENIAQCPSGACVAGNRPIIVAGGKLDIVGLPETCPSWTKLKNVHTLNPPSNPVVPTYTPPASSDCTNIVIDTNFENASGIAWPDQWYRNYGGTDSYETDDGGASNYAKFSGRTSSWNGPQTNFNPYCIVPNVEYFVTAKAKLTGITSTTCLELMQFRRDPGANPEKRWNGRGSKCIPASMDDTWFTFSSVTVFDELTANPLDPTSYDRRLYWQKPPAGVDISLDDVKIFRLPSSFFPDTSGDDACHELFINGDAQDTTIHPATYPFPARLGTQNTVTIESEPGVGFFETNYFYAVRNRATGYDTPRSSLWTGCIEKDFVYHLSFDIRVHSSTKKTFRAQLTVTQPNGSLSWPWLLVCGAQDITDGWQHCSGDYQFRELDSTASKIEFYLISDDDSTSDLDLDNFSFGVKAGPAKGIVVPDANGELASCWGESSDILITSPSLTFDDVETSTITSVTANGDGTTTLELEDPIGATSYLDNEPDYAVEVALLSRNILFESDSTASDKGGHLMVMHTPHVAQSLQGVAVKRFGQQGSLGRYPVHFHMSGCVHGSVVSKVLVRESNQRCYVIHGSHNVTLDSNVAYDTKGHCFLLEDSGEMDNLLTGNLAAVTRAVETKIRAEESDDTPSSFWLTNPMNHFIGNVAAGSEHSGFWFEMKGSVREPTKSMSLILSLMNPSWLPLHQFQDNVAHSCHEHGVKTYPGTGLKPFGDPAIFKNTKSYRNRGDGVFIHNSRNIVVDGGIFADNRIALDIDRSPTCSVQGATVIGYSPEYKALAGPAAFRKHCPSIWPLRGVELHTYWSGGDLNTGTNVTSTFFDHFEDSGCDGSTALRIDRENKGYFDVRTTVSSLSFASGNEPLSSCDAVSSTDEEMGPIDNVAIHDVDGSIMGVPGYVVSNNQRMTAFANCTSHESSCTAHCPGVCFRTMGLSVSTFEDDDLLLEISDVDSGVSVSITGEYEWPLNDDGSINMEEHTKTHRSRRFFATLPSGGSYQARFLKNGETHWPLFVKQQYEDPGQESPSCLDFDSFTVEKPDVGPGYCDELIRNGDVEDDISDWWATMGGVVAIDVSASGQGHAITSSYRTAEWMGPSQYFDSRCMTVGSTFRVSAKVKLINKTTGASLNCDNLAGDCPRFTLKYESGAWSDLDEGWVGIGGRDDYWDSSLEWQSFVYDFTVSEQMANAGSHLLYSECSTLDALIVLDDVSVQAI